MTPATHASPASRIERERIVAGAASHRGAIIRIAVLAWLAMLPVTMLTAPLKELIHAGPFAAHAFQSINMLGAFVCVPLIARFYHRRAMLKNVAALALSVDGVLLATMSLAPNAGWMLGIRFFEGAAHVIGISALMAIGAKLAPDTRRGRTMGLIGAAMMFGTACGTRLGGPLWTILPMWFFYIAGLIAAIAGLGTLLMAADTRPEQNPDRTPWTRVLGEHPSLAIAYAYAFIDRFCVGVVISTFVLFLANVHGLGPDERSRLLVLFLLPMAVLVYPAGRLADRVGRVRPIALGSAAFGVVFASYGLVPLTWMPAVMIASGVLSALMFAPNLTLCADLAPEAHRGAAFTGFNIAGSLGFLLGPLVAGSAMYLMQWMEFSSVASYRMAFIVAGGGEVICAALTLPMLRDLARRGVTR